ncbi:DUF6069 family protein [Halogeometricum limi]|uniref:Major facilitator superfamily (MFS) profile domain-containing protein n=1 Tax=Halogeometricum limi TaxID=555875 RepID=A0A1I6I2Y9_9EURY|nr:DUF6069 family protein [Halogeometricum limi]SFR61057.1 hypothetical protein SAMN04488124_2747 [Halogeometricum limi]
MQLTTTRAVAPTSAGDLARQTAFGVLVALAFVFATRVVVGLLGVDLGVSGAASPFATAPILGSTVVAGIGAAVAYAVLDRATARPARNFVVLAAGVFAAMMVPVLTFAPELGVTPAGQLVLTAFHVFVAVPLVAFVVGAVRL